MTLALFPLGAVAIYQTNRVAIGVERNAELALLALTGRAAKAEELIIERALGAAQLLAATAGDYADDPEKCAADLGRFVESNRHYSFVGLLPLSGQMTCASSGTTFDFSGFPDFAETMAAQERTVTVNTDAPLSGTSVFILSEPFFVDGAFVGFISISVPHDGLPGTPENLAELGLVELVTFNDDGDILTARSDIETAAQEMPVNGDIAQSSSPGAAFQGKNQLGHNRVYTVVPIEGSPVSVMGIWQGENVLVSTVAATLRPAVFPVLMWLASMSVAMLSIYTLVLRHIARLRRNMDAFADNRNVDLISNQVSMPSELKALNDNFQRMTNEIMQDEAELEDALRAKNVLVKEVHHRVKNNLQLISSIMNMQIRTAEHHETKAVLSRLQDRVLSLATIHRDLYQSQNGGMVEVGALISEVVQNSVEVAVSSVDDVDLKTDIDHILLYPDQAVPLSLMVAEAMTNAMKYIGAAEGQQQWVKVTLKQEPGSMDCVLTLSNSTGPDRAAESTGLGGQLINAFAIQLGGDVQTDESAESYTMRVHFTAAEFEPELRDY
jgi:two-component sensor histidine kinase